MPISQLEPKEVWRNFAALNAIPRASKKEEKVVQHVLAFAEKLGLDSTRDNIGNVIIRKPGTGAGAKKAPVILQAHLDMVHQKNGDTLFDFETQGIEMYVQGGWVKARGTTLGADNGIGAAYILALLENDNLDLPPLEALFTIDEEAGMTGAKNLEEGLLKGKLLVNLDTEDENEITIGCAGGLDTVGEMSYAPEAAPQNSKAYYLSVTGLKGGHSGMDIHLGRGNANKILNRLLFDSYEHFGLRVSSIDGGGLRNAISRESFAVVMVDISRQLDFEAHITNLGKLIQSELHIADPDAKIQAEATAAPVKVMPLDIQEKLLKAIYAVPNGVFRMSDAVPGLVETSNNLARIIVKDGNISLQALQRSSVESSKRDVGHAVKGAMQLCGLDVVQSGDYPGWAPDRNSPLLAKTVEVFKKVMGKDPHILACHAGLECGIIQSHYPGLDMVSIGPTIRNAHSPDEKAEIASVAKSWELLKNLLQSL